jgi:hypothetical protein
MEAYYGWLIAFYVITAAVLCWWRIRHGDDLFAILIVFLVVYSVFTQIGYVYLPDLAVGAHIYFGPQLFPYYWTFVWGSLVATALLRPALRLRHLTLSERAHEPRPWRRFSPAYFLIVAAAFEAVMAYVFVTSYDSIQYANIEQKWVAYLINVHPICVLMLYMKARTSRTFVYRSLATLLVIAATALFMLISFRAGQRLNSVALFSAILFFELSPFRVVSARKLGRIVGASLIGVAFLVMANRIVALRLAYQGATPLSAILSDDRAVSPGSQADPLRQIVDLDYFPPSTLIFASIYYDWVVPAEVFKSNLFNAVMFLGYPYLSSTVSGMVADKEYSRAASYGYYIFTEGFNAVGWLGIVYNGIVMNVGFRFWELFLRSRSPRFNRYAGALIAYHIVGLVRAQSVTFLRSAYLGIIPGLVLVALACGGWPRWSWRREEE